MSSLKIENYLGVFIGLDEVLLFYVHQKKAIALTVTNIYINGNFYCYAFIG
jgi:hypothetical protein